MIEDFEKILLSDVKDIRGLDDVSMFPLALGWWIIIAIMVLFLAMFIYKRIQNFRYNRTWKYKVIKRLDKISDNLNESNVKASLAEITEILKRASIQSYGRNEVASLNGDDWLGWLEIMGSGNFNKSKYKELLIDYPYMEEYKIPDKMKEIKSLIKIIKNWL